MRGSITVEQLTLVSGGLDFVCCTKSSLDANQCFAATLVEMESKNINEFMYTINASSVAHMAFGPMNLFGDANPICTATN